VQDREPTDARVEDADRRGALWRGNHWAPMFAEAPRAPGTVKSQARGRRALARMI
jgi:hypothetical protein